MIRASVMKETGYFHPSWRGSEDIDYWLRVSRKGKLAYINEPLTEWHHYFSNTTKYGNFAFYYDTITFYKKIRAELGDKKYLRPVINKRLAHYAFAGGYEALAVQSLPQARQFFIKSCFYQPWQLKSWLYTLLTCLPAQVFYKLRSLKQQKSLV